MPRTAPSRPARKASVAADAVHSDLLNRRVAIRYPASPAIEAVLAGRRRKAAIHDVSQGGLAVVLKQPLEIGETLFVQVTNRLLDFSFDLAAEVRHVHPLPRGSWVVGLQFDEPLSLAELAALL